MIKIYKYLDSDLIVFLNAKTRDEALQTLIDHLYQKGKIGDTQHFYQAIVDREKIVSTGIGMGVAIPRCKTYPVRRFFYCYRHLKVRIRMECSRWGSRKINIHDRRPG